MNKRQVIITVTTVIAVSLFIILSTGCVPPNIHVHPSGGGSGGGGGGGGMEWNTNRPGSDLAAGHTVSNPNQCRNACNSHSGCRAWTYVKPGVQGPNAKCWLKHSVPAAQPSSCCVSGVKSGGAPPPPPPQWNNNTNRPGMDMAPGQPVINAVVCRNRCNATAGCRAWTYVKPGIQGPSAKCWLKNGVPAAQPSSCCTSGVK